MNRTRTLAPSLAALFFTVSLLSSLFTSPGFTSPGLAQTSSPGKPRARDLGVPFEGVPGPLNAITDVAGVAVGHTTLISGEGKLELEVGKGPVRTGLRRLVSLNGNGEMTGTTWGEQAPSRSKCSPMTG